MAQFKVGDVVRRIETDNGDHEGKCIRVGDVLTVTKVDTGGWLFFNIAFIGSSNPRYFELVYDHGFQVGDKVRRKAEYQGNSWTCGDRMLTITGLSNYAGADWLDFSGLAHGGFASRFELVESIAPVVEHTARANDPATSVAAGKVKRDSLRNRIKVLFSHHKYECTGHEIANLIEAPLNSVTPRLAELRRAGKIKDSGQRRDKQIVWVLA